jgi:hypothetical protein
MVINNNSYEEQTRRLLGEAQSELRNLEEQIAELHEKREAVAGEVNAYETALHGYLKRTGRQIGVGVDWKKLLSPVETHKDRIKLIAAHYGGKVKVTQATDILFGNGFINTKKRANAYVIVQSTLADLTKKGIFKKFGPGEYGLIGAQQSLLK